MYNITAGYPFEEDFTTGVGHESGKEFELAINHFELSLALNAPMHL